MMDVWGRIFMGLTWGFAASLWSRLARTLHPSQRGPVGLRAPRTPALSLPPVRTVYRFASCGPERHAFCGAASCPGRSTVDAQPSGEFEHHERRRVIDFEPHLFPDGPMHVERYPESVGTHWIATSAREGREAARFGIHG